MGDWTADVANNPSNDYSLYIEIGLDGEHRASIVRNDSGQLVLRWYADKADADVPVEWPGCTMTKKLARIIEEGSVAELEQALAGREASFEESCEALHQAVRLGRVAFVRALIAGGASVEAPAHPASWRPIHTAVEHGQLEAIRVLVVSGADVNASAEEGMTPLHLAVDAATDSIEQVGSTDGLAVVRCLLDLGANPRVQDDTGRTPRDWALEAGSEVVSKILA